MKDESLENNLVTLHGRGWSVRRLSREFDISRERVNRILFNNEDQRSGSTAVMVVKTKSSPKLDDYKQYIGELLEQYPDPPPTN